MHSAYKHLDSKLRIAELSLGQWFGVLAGVASAIAWAYLSPFGLSLTLTTAVYVAALPAATALFASLTEFDLLLLVRSAIRWRRLAGRFAPGAGESARGYVVHADEHDQNGRGEPDEIAAIDLATLWERS